MPQPEAGSRATALSAGLVMLVAAAAAVALSRPPAPLPVTAPGDAFSAERALAHVAVIARAPHPMGSPEHAVVREYVAHALETLGLEVEVQRTTAITAKYRDAGVVENVVARRRGSVRGGDGRGHDAVMLAAHSDSVAAGPGAADDGSGVAALLEAMRALAQGPASKNDLIVLVSDGEELGLLGASAFMDEHPWAKDVRVVVNLEARGNAGVASLFETSSDNGALVGLAAGAAPHLVGSSLAYEVYKRMPNDTDVTVFKAHGLAALNFAFVGNWAAYHTKADDPEHLDSGALQQQGDYALGLARALGEADLRSLRAPDAVYFSLPGGIFVHHAARYTWLGSLACALVLGVGVARGRRVGGVATGGVVCGVLLAIGGAGVSALAGFGAALAAERAHGGLLPEGDVVGSAPYAWAVAATALGSWGAVFALLRRRTSVRSLAAGTASVLLVATLVTAAYVPGVSYVFLWPAVAAALPLALYDTEPRARVAVAVAAAIGPILVLAPLMHGVFEGLGVGAAGGALLGVLVATLASASILALDVVAAPPYAIGAFTLAVACVAFATGAMGTRYSAEHPKPSQLFYSLDEATGKAVWASTAAHGDAWTDAFVGATPTRAPLFPGWHAWRQGPAEPAATPAVATVTSTEVSHDVGTRTLRVTLHTVQPEEIGLDTFSSILDATVNGKPVPAPRPGDNWTLSLMAVSGDVTLILHVDGAVPLRLSLTEHTRGIPAVAGKPARPAWTTERHGGDQTLVRRTLSL